MPEEKKETTEPEADNSVLKEFMDAIPKEGQMPAEEGAVEEPSAPPAEKTEPKPERKKDDMGFASHPRWKQIREEKRLLEEKVAKYDEKFAEIESRLGKSQETIPKWFTDRFGDDPATWSSYKETTSTEKADLKREIMLELKADASNEAKRAEEMEAWVKDSVQELRDDGEEFDENRLLKILCDYAPTDNQGNIDFRKGLSLLREMDSAKASEDSAKSKARKEVASATTASSAGGGKTKGPIPAKLLRRMSFQDLVQD